MMRKTVLWTLILICMLCVPMAFADGYQAIPEPLQVTQRTETTNLSHDRYIALTYPETANQQVNETMAALIDRMAAQAKPFLPASGLSTMRSYLDVGSSITRCGTRWMSFLTIARIADRRVQTYCDFDARLYNMETGALVTLSEVIREDSVAWLRDEARRQLEAAYPMWQADEEALDALLSDEGLNVMPFTLTPGHLALHVSTQRLYPEADPSLLHVELYLPELQAHLTDTAHAEMDVSGYRLIALTYDDGVVRATTNRLMDVLREYAAQGTFFVVGERIAGNSDILHRGYDAGHSEQSHNWVHVYTGLTPEKILSWKAQMDKAMEEAIGVRPVMIRAPGGVHEKYADADTGLPVIGWSATASDATTDEAARRNVSVLASHVTGSAHDGVIVLMHDINEVCAQYNRVILEKLTKEGYLCVTVQDLFAARGLPLEGNTIYASGKLE